MKSHYKFICDTCGKASKREVFQHPENKFKSRVKSKTSALFTGKNYCCNKCKHKGQITRQAVLCSWCNKNLLKSMAEIRQSKSGRMFCNKSCAASYNNTQKRKSKRSKCEEILFNLIKNRFLNLEILANDKKMLDGLELDISIPSLNLGIEWNGIVHFQPIYGQSKLDQIQKFDMKKQKLAAAKGIMLIVVPDLVSTSKYVNEAFYKIADIIEKLQG